MNILYLLIGCSVLMALVFLAAFFWSLKDGQHDDVVTPGCDAIMKGSSLPLLPKFYQLSRDGLKVIKISFAIAIAYNCIGLYYAVQGTLYPLTAAVLMPISTITIITYTSLATHFFARKHHLS